MENLNLLIAFAAGLLSFVSPCVLPLVPVYISHLTGSSVNSVTGNQSRVIPFFHAVSFVAGFSVVFIVLGVSIGLMGTVLRDQMPVLRRFGGILLVVMGLHLAGILKIPFLYHTKQLDYTPRPGVSYFRSATIGATFSVGWTPCVGPILGSILTLAATSGTVAQGAFLLVAYSLGLGIPFLATGAALSSVTGYLKKLNPHMGKISLISGLLLIAVGVMIFTNRLILLNKYFDFFGLGSGI